MTETFEQCSMNFSVVPICNAPLNLTSLSTADYFNSSAVLRWLISRLRIFLYLSNPYEESFQHENEIADYHTETFPLLVFFVFFEWFILYLKGKPLPFLGDSFASASMIVMMECTRILTRGVEHTAYIYIYSNYRLIDLPWKSAFTWYLSAILVDFCYYWGHRISHECNILWSHHQAHHSSETYSLVNTFRLPFTQDWLYSFAYLPMAFFISPAHYLVHHQLNLLYQFWLHTEVIGKMGRYFEWVEYIFNTPSHHRVHHGCNKFCLDKNYGAWLIIWDRMFGTFQEEKEDEEIVYGLVEQVDSFNPLYLQLFYFKKNYDKWIVQDGWKNKLQSLIKGPGWRPGSPWTGNLEEVPDVKGRQKYVYKSKNIYWNVYVFIHFFIVLFAYQSVSLLRMRMTQLSVFCHLTYVVFSLATWGFFYDDNPLAPLFELIRCIIFFFYSYSGIPLLSHLLAWSGFVNYTLEASLYWLLRVFFFVSTVFWVMVVVDRETSDRKSLQKNLIDKGKYKLP